jgi:DNA-directed RNA polymerase specialized sigma subunit
MVDFKNIIREWLNSFKRDKQKLETKIITYNAIETNIPGDAIQYDRDKLSATNKINSVVESKAILLAELSEEIERIEYKRAFITEGLDKLTNVEQQVIRYRYIEDEYMTWRDISKLVGRSQRQCMTIRDRAIEKMDDFMR